MPDALIEVEGIQETADALERAPRAVVARAFLKALQAGGGVIEQAVSVRTPKDTGDMKESLVTVITLDSQFRGGTAEIGFGKQGYKANWVEYGHHMVGHKPDKKDEGEVQPHPFMRPATADSAEAAIDEFADTLAETLEEGLLKNVA